MKKRSSQSQYLYRNKNKNKNKIKFKFKKAIWKKEREKEMRRAYAERVGESGAEAGGELLSRRHLEERGPTSLPSYLKQHFLSFSLSLSVIEFFGGSGYCTCTCSCGWSTKQKWIKKPICYSSLVGMSCTFMGPHHSATDHVNQTRSTQVCTIFFFFF